VNNVGNAHNEYPWHELFEPLGKTVGYAFIDELEMWQVLYNQYPTMQIQAMIDPFFRGIRRETIRRRVKKAGVKLRGPGGYHDTEDYKHRKKKAEKRKGVYESKPRPKMTERLCQYKYCKHKDKRLPSGRRYMHKDCMEIVSKHHADLDCYGGLVE